MVPVEEQLYLELIEKIKYEQWNGVMPSVQGTDGIIVDIG